MGSYGIGVSRLVGAIIEAKYNDKDEIMKWPFAVSPYDIAIIPLISKNETLNIERANSVYNFLKEKNIDVILDFLDKHNIKATFFILGSVAKDMPSLVYKIAYSLVQ